MTQSSLKGIQLQVTKKGFPIYYTNYGIKNEKNQTINSRTLFKVASLSKSFSAVSIMQLIQKGLINITDNISDLLGFNVINPNHPTINITLQMILSHLSSINQTEIQYGNFVNDTLHASDGYSVPDLRQILLPGGKYYNPNTFSSKMPGQFFCYSNLNYIIVGTIVQKISNLRFDIYQQKNILDFYNKNIGASPNCTYNIAKIQYPKDLGTIYVGIQGKWIPNWDNYPNETIPEKNLTGYTIGKNAAVFSPQAGLRASVFHLNVHMNTLANGGITHNGDRILSQKSVNQILKLRYQNHGSSGGQQNDYNLYGFGIYKTSYFYNDTVIDHQVVQGHLGDNSGLISAYFFFQDYSFSYIINGALYGYKNNTGTIYEYERQYIHKAVNEYINEIQEYTQQKMKQIKIKFDRNINKQMKFYTQ